MSATVLVVEDEPQIQELVAVNLEHIGHKVLRAASAEEAEAAIRNALPDVLVLDWMLPGESGLRSRGACAPTSARASCRSSCSPRAPWSTTRSRG